MRVQEVVSMRKAHLERGIEFWKALVRRLRSLTAFGVTKGMSEMTKSTSEMMKGAFGVRKSVLGMTKGVIDVINSVIGAIREDGLRGYWDKLKAIPGFVQSRTNDASHGVQTPTCFIFTRQLDEEHVLSMRLNAQGKVEADLAARSMDDIKALQTEARTIVVLPTELVTLFELELPKLAESKLRAAIPFALEDQLSQAVDSLHFTHRRLVDKNGYLVAAMDRVVMMHLLAQLDALDLIVDCVTLDWFALEENQFIISETGLLVHRADFKGALNPRIAEQYRAKQAPDEPIMAFSDSVNHAALKPTQTDTGRFKLWVAERLTRTKPLNLAQGLLRTSKRQMSVRRWYQVCGIVVAVYLVSFILLNGISAIILAHKIADVDNDIAQVYRQFFPNAQHVISPRFRISQLLKTTSSGQGQLFWTLLNQLSSQLDPKSFAIEQWRYKDQTLAVTLTSKDFAALEALQTRLQAAGIKVTQTQAASRKEEVLATLELRL